VAAATVALQAAETLGRPVLGWTISETVAAQLNQEFSQGTTGHQDGEIDLRVTVDRARQRLASRIAAGEPVPGSVQWRQLEMLAETQSLRWLRPPKGAAGHSRASDPGSAQA
jgi:hypothetical protein